MFKVSVLSKRPGMPKTPTDLRVALQKYHDRIPGQPVVVANTVLGGRRREYPLITESAKFLADHNMVRLVILKTTISRISSALCFTAQDSRHRNLFIVLKCRNSRFQICLKTHRSSYGEGKRLSGLPGIFAQELDLPGS